jgi:hypothetical protein
MVSSGMLRRVALVRTDVSEELSASFIRVTRIGVLGTAPVVTSNRCTLRRHTFVLRLLKIVVFWDIETQFVPHRRHVTSPLQSPASECYVRFEMFTGCL